MWFEFTPRLMQLGIEEPRGKPRGIFDGKEFHLILIRSLTPQQAAENALAIAVYIEWSGRQDLNLRPQRPEGHSPLKIAYIPAC